MTHSYTTSGDLTRLRLYSENYVEPTPPSQHTRDAATGGDTGIQTGFMDRTRRLDH